MNALARRLLAAAAVLGSGALAMTAATLVEPRTDASLFEVPLESDADTGELYVDTDEAAVLGVSGGVVWARALGLAPRVQVAWRGSGKVRPIEVRLENVNLRASEVTLSPGAREVSRRGTTLVVSGQLAKGPISVAAAVSTATAASARFVVVGCTRSNSLMANLLEKLARDPPLFLVHLGDLSHGLGHECEAIRASFDRIGVPIFASPGNHDLSPVSETPLRNFHRYLNPAPLVFTVAGQRFFILDFADYPVASAQLDWLERGLKEASGMRSWVFLHRPPVDPLGLGREIPAQDGSARFGEIVARSGDVRVYGAHLGGYATCTFAGHPFVMTSGGGEELGRKEGGPYFYHHLLVALDGRGDELVKYDEPGMASRLVSRLEVELPVFFGRPLAGLAAAAAMALLLGFFRVRRARSRKSAAGETWAPPEPRPFEREATTK